MPFTFVDTGPKTGAFEHVPSFGPNSEKLMFPVGLLAPERCATSVMVPACALNEASDVSDGKSIVKQPFPSGVLALLWTELSCAWFVPPEMRSPEFGPLLREPWMS